MIKIALLSLGTVVSTCFFYLCAQTRSPLSDVFTTERISILKDRPKNIEKDIIVDLSRLDEHGGIWALTKAIISGVAKKRPNWRLIVLVQKNAIDLPDAVDNIKIVEVENISYPFIPNNSVFIPTILGSIHDKLLQLLDYDRIFCDQYCDLFWDPVGYPNVRNFVSLPRISTVHDLAVFDLPFEFFPTRAYAELMQTHILKAIEFSKKIITVSDFSKKRICERFSVSEDCICEIPIKLSARVLSDNDQVKRDKVLDKHKLRPQKYFIFCSTWGKHKNHKSLIEAFNEFTKKNPEIKLILVGKAPKHFQGEPIESYKTDRLIIAGFVSDDELAIILKNALAFIHPSVYEGFGMPIIEAMANGIPVACSNVASLPEVAGNAALLFDPFDINSIVEAMHRLVDNPKLRAELIQKGYVQAKKYENRDEMVDEYIRVMEEVMEKTN